MTSRGCNVVVYPCRFGGSVFPSATLSACVHRQLSVAFRLHFSFHVLILFGHLVHNTLENELFSIYDLRLQFCLDMPSCTELEILHHPPGGTLKRKVCSRVHSEANPSLR